MMRICGSLFLSLLILAGCGTMEKVTDLFKGDEDNAEPPAPLVGFREKVSVIELWSKSTGSGTNEQYLKLAPIVAKQRIYVADSSGSLKAMDATNGKILWTASAIDKKGFWSKDEPSSITGGPGYGENTVFLGTDEGGVIAYSADTGKEFWRARVSSEILSAPQQAEGICIVRTIDGKIFALDGDSGKRLWIYDRSVPALTLRGTSIPVIYAGAVIAGFDGGRLAVLELRTGKLIWETRISDARGSSELDRMVDIDAEPVVVEGVVYVATFQGHIAAVQLETGRILWTRDVSSYSGFSVDDNNLYVSDEKSNVLAFDRFTGTSVWKQEKLYARQVTAPTIIGDYVVVGDLEGYLHWLDKYTGEFVARVTVSKERIIAAPIVAGKFLYAYSSDGVVSAYTYR